MKYLIGDVARTLGLTPGALHYFEREGVISPEKEESGRRLYSEQDVFRLMSYKKYRAMGIPVKEIAAQFAPGGDGLPEIARRLTQRREASAERERHYRAVQRGIAWFEEAIARIPTHLDRFDVCSSPDVHLLCNAKDGLVPQGQAAQERTQAWLQRMPETRLSVVLDMDGRASFCQAVEDNPPVEDEGTAEVLRLAPMISLHTVACVSSAFFEAPGIAFDGALAFLAAHGFTRAGDALGHVIVVDCRGSLQQVYVELWMPFTAFA